MRHSQQESREKLKWSCHHFKSTPNISVHSTEPDFPALPRLSRRVSTHTKVVRVIALWESLEGSQRSLCQLDRKPETAATAREESGRACLHSRLVLTPLRRLQKNPKIHVSTGEESSGPALSPHKVLGPSIHGRGIPRGPRATRMGTGLSCGHQSGSLRSPS